MVVSIIQGQVGQYTLVKKYEDFNSILTLNSDSRIQLLEQLIATLKILKGYKLTWSDLKPENIALK